MSGFAKKWASATSVGREFGLSAIAVHKMLEAAGLRDSVLKAPTPDAVKRGWAVSTPLANGKPHYMWSRLRVTQFLRAHLNSVPVEQVALADFIRMLSETGYEGSASDRTKWHIVDNALETLEGLSVSEELVFSVCKSLRFEAHAHDILKMLSTRASR